MAVTTVRTPQLGVNDTTATLVGWQVEAGAQIETGILLCELETAKSTYEVEAPAAGLVLPLVGKGAEVAVNQPLALIGPEMKALEEVLAAMKPAASGASEVKATAKARELALRLGVDLAAIPTSGIIRERDVMAFARREEGDPFAIAPIAGQIDPAFRRRIAADPAFAMLPSEEKVRHYREAGASIGEAVRIEAGALILADAIDLGREVVIGAGTRITAETIRMGRMSAFGERCRVICRHIRIGDVFYTGPEVLIGGSDSFSETDKLITGDQCLVSGFTFLDTGNGIRLGNEVALSPHVKLYTHQHWQNMLEGYHATFGPIVIEDGAYVTGDCLVAPAVRIGAGATVLANSTVAGNVEPMTIVSGNPARPVGKVETPSPERKERILERLLEQMEKALAGRLAKGSVLYQPRFDPHAQGDARIIVTFDAGEAAERCPPGLVLFDVGAYRVHGDQNPQSDEVRNFLRRRGIRFKPIHWRYRGWRG